MEIRTVTTATRVTTSHAFGPKKAIKSLLILLSENTDIMPNKNSRPDPKQRPMKKFHLVVCLEILMIEFLFDTINSLLAFLLFSQNKSHIQMDAATNPSSLPHK